MQRVNDLNDVLTVSDIVEFLSIGRGQAYELVHSKEFHTVRVGSRILIPKKAFLAWFEGKN